ncbi:MAG: hypothetical protein AAF467_03225 [Actinomycetota bacterium]
MNSSDDARRRPLFDTPRARSGVDYGDLFDERGEQRRGRAVEYYPDPNRPGLDLPLLVVGISLILVALAALGLRVWIAPETTGADGGVTVTTIAADTEADAEG